MSLAQRIDGERIPAGVREVCARLRERGHRAWIVGGCVRDLLRGAEVNDWDVCTSALPKETQRAFKKVVPTGIAHGTVTVLWKGEGYEVTTLRGEGAYTDGRRPDEVFFVRDIEEDLARRDFTVNAIAYDPTSEELVDPFDGRGDLERGVLRAVGVAAERFAEDGLRILRGARFVATLGLALEPDTEAAFAPTLDVFAKVSPERVREEWLKAMKAERPSPAFEVMKRTGILARCGPLLDRLDADAWRKSLAAVDRTEVGDASFRLAALLFESGRDRHEELEGWLRDYRYSNDERREVTELVRHAAALLADPPTDAPGWRRWVAACGRPRAPRAVALAGRVTDRDESAWAESLTQVMGDPITTGDLAVDGKDVMDTLGQRGRIVGEVLRALLDEVLDDPARNTREHLLERITALGGEG